MRIVAAFAAVVAILLSACSTNGSDTTRPLTVFGPYRATDASNFASALARFEIETGIEVRYTGSADFVRDLRDRVEGGVSLPDIAIVPQPGVIDELIESARLVPLSEPTRDAVNENYEVTADPQGTFVAPYRSAIKSLIWYRPEVFEENGWTVPTTLDELRALVDDIAAAPRDAADSKIAPWCFAMFAGSATGWVATDWVEDLLLRQSGPGVYDEWMTGIRDFSDPAVVEAFETFHDLVLDNGRVAGNLPAILETDVTEASAPLFGEEPGCAMYKQASIATGWFPDDVTPGEDVDFFVVPAGAATPPLVTAGDGLVQFSEDERVDRLIEFLVSPDGSREWARRGGYLSARTSVDVDEYYDGIDQRFADLLLEDRVERFDASDSMPPDIGSALFWTEITKWIRGSTTLEEFLATMDEARAAR